MAHVLETLARARAQEILVGSMRKHFPEDAGLSDDEVIAAHGMGEQLDLLAKYLLTIMAAQTRLDAAMADAP